MQTVSPAWKRNQEKSLLGEGFVEVSLDITDEDAVEDASWGDNGANYLSNTSEVLSESEKTIVDYPTLEQNMWILDGRKSPVPVTNATKSGFVSDVLCDKNCQFGVITPIISVLFTQVHTMPIPGVTVVWSPTLGEYPTAFTVIAYNGESVVASKSVTDNTSTTSIVMMDICDYDRIDIHINQWCLPYHRVRVETLFVGVHKVYAKGNLFGYTHEQTVDPISTALPKASISFSVDNSDNTYNPYNEEGLSKYLMQRQEVKARYGYKMDDGRVEWVKGGTFYLSSWKAAQNSLKAEFTARDLLEFMSAAYTDTQSSVTPRTLYELAESVLASCDLPTTNEGEPRWIISESLKGITTTAPLPQDTAANCLQMIANAGCCVVYPDRDGYLHIEPTSGVQSEYAITYKNSYTRPEVTTSKPLKQIVVKYHTYTKGTDGFTSIPTEVVTPISASGESVVIDNPLITDRDRALAVGEWVVNYARHRTTLDISWRPDVSMDVLDIVSAENAFGTHSALITDAKYTFNGAFRGTAKGRVMQNE